MDWFMLMLQSIFRRWSSKTPRETLSKQLSAVLPVQQHIQQQQTHILLRTVLFSNAASSSEDAGPVKPNGGDQLTSASSFRRHRDALALHWLTEFDAVAFDGQLLKTKAALGSPIVTLKWSNRLRTTAGRAHLISETARRRLPKEFPPSSHALPEPRRTAVIELSTKVVDDIDRLKITLLHEMCHAAAWIVDGSLRPPHGAFFQKWAQRAATSIPSIAITTKHNFKIQYKYSWKCVNPACSVQFIGRHRKRSIDIQRHVCGKCYGPLQVTVADETSSSAEAACRPLTEYHQFVQRHSKCVARQLRQKQRNRKTAAHRKVSPQKVMKETARLWQKQKEQTNASPFDAK